MWMDNFRRQRSFDYEYETKMRTVDMVAEGFCVVGQGERLEGVWRSSGGEQEFEYIGLGDVEFSRSGRIWERSTRGEQSDIFTQISRIVTADEFEYQGFDAGYWYRFKANVPFLSPERRKEMIGVLKISSDDYLPSYIWAGLPDSSTFWKARLWRYNGGQTVKPPQKGRAEFLLTASGEVLDGKVVSKRLDMLRIDHRIRKVDDGLLVSVADHYGTDDLDAMLKPGRTVVYGVAQRREDAARIGYVSGDPARPVLLSDAIMAGKEIKGVDLRFDRRSTPYLSLKLRNKRRLPAMIALEVDSVIVLTAPIDTLKMLSRIDVYPDMQYREMEILRSQLLQPLNEINVSSPVGENR